MRLKMVRYGKGREKKGSAFTSGPLLLRIIDHYNLCDLEWDKGKQWLHLEQGPFTFQLNILPQFGKKINCPIPSHLTSFFFTVVLTLFNFMSIQAVLTIMWTDFYSWQYSPLRIYWNSPWVQARRSYGGFHLQISSLIYCYQLCCPSERKQGVYGFQCLLKDHSGMGPVSHDLFRQCRRN